LTNHVKRVNDVDAMAALDQRGSLDCNKFTVIGKQSKTKVVSK